MKATTTELIEFIKKLPDPNSDCPDTICEAFVSKPKLMQESIPVYQVICRKKFTGIRH